MMVWLAIARVGGAVVREGVRGMVLVPKMT